MCLFQLKFLQIFPVSINHPDYFPPTVSLSKKLIKAAVFRSKGVNMFKEINVFPSLPTLTEFKTKMLICIMHLLFVVLNIYNSSLICDGLSTIYFWGHSAGIDNFLRVHFIQQGKESNCLE